ncbi:hypothetical protein P3X46_032404 [Hevea brasiliensis]|uniref:F-box domain-containing protein n=1 Tax=Hevea brasiliensis TaxID=3981 RepID=A0ABQ9KD71_HEVBR|nr:F-box protein At3g07870-like [Hevea brasiliensis]KAJ9135195.1 hypothetical protein P3X46_032404 [Hevea brasiliensis]
MASNNGVEEHKGITSIKSPSKHQPATWLERLPWEIYLDILSRQPIMSLLDCKLVSRLWYTSVKHPSLANMHLNHATEDDLYLILFSDWPKSTLQLVQVRHPEGTRTVKTLNTTLDSVFPEFEVVGSCNGLVCLYNYHFDDPLYILNPFAIEYRELPRFEASPPSNICRVVFGFGFHPNTKDYKVIKIVYYKQRNNDLFGGNPEAFVLTLANVTPAWRNIGKIGYDLIGPTSEALVNGKLHWLTFIRVQEEVSYREIISFDLETEQFQVVPRPSCGGLNQSNYHLVTLRSCLSAVVTGGGSNEIWVMKVYNVQTSWSKELVIGNYVPHGMPMAAPPSRRKKNGYQGGAFRVLCGLKNGEMLILHSKRSIVSYDPNNGEFKELNFQGLPLEFEATVHMGSLISVHTLFSMKIKE